MLARHLPILLAVAACSSDGRPGPQPDALRTTIAETSDELAAYNATIHMVTTKTAVDYAVADHQARMTTLIGDMGDYLYGMGSCMDTQHMSGQRRGIVLELQMHVATMQDLTTIESERIEVDRHVNVTDGLLVDMNGMLDASALCAD